MNPFTAHSTTRFCADLPAAIRGVDGAAQKAAAAASALATFLNAHSFENVSSIDEKRRCKDGRFSVPHPVFVVISNSITGYGRGPNLDKHLKPKGKVTSFAIRDSWQLVVHGAEALLKQSPAISDLCRYLADFLRQELQDLPESASDRAISTPGRTEFIARIGDGLNETFQVNPKLISPLLEGLEILNDSANGDSPERRPRWVWLAKTRPPTKDSQPFVYLHWPAGREPGKRELPWIVNPQGEHAIVHAALGEKSPRITWNYSNDDDWAISPENKKIFKRRARADLYPHLLYVPVLRWLAIQRSFGPSDNPLALLDQCEHFAGLAPVVMLNCFEEALFQMILELFMNNPTLNPDRVSTDKRIAAEIKSLIQFVLDFYPVPLLQLVPDQIYPALTPKYDSDRLANAFSSHGNGAITRALQAASSHAQMRDFQKFGSTLMGTIHTIKRPLEYMRNFANQVKTEPTSPELQERAVEALNFLARQEAFANLDLAALTPIFEDREKLVNDHVAPVAILNILRVANYDPQNLSSDLNLTHKNAVTLRDPGQQLPVRITWQSNVSYRGHAGPLALIIAELVDNAAKYLATEPLMGSERVVNVALCNSEIAVTNPIVLTEKDVIQRRIDDARNTPGRSLNHVLHLGNLMNYEIIPAFVSPSHYQFTCRHTA